MRSCSSQPPIEYSPARGLAYSSNGGDGTLTVVREEKPEQFRVAATIPTQPSTGQSLSILRPTVSTCRLPTTLLHPQTRQRPSPPPPPREADAGVTWSRDHLPSWSSATDRRLACSCSRRKRPSIVWRKGPDSGWLLGARQKKKRYPGRSVLASHIAPSYDPTHLSRCIAVRHLYNVESQSGALIYERLSSQVPAISKAISLEKFEDRVLLSSLPGTHSHQLRADIHKLSTPALADASGQTAGGPVGHAHPLFVKVQAAPMCTAWQAAALRARP